MLLRCQGYHGLMCQKSSGLKKYLSISFYGYLKSTEWLGPQDRHSLVLDGFVSQLDTAGDITEKGAPLEEMPQCDPAVRHFLN